MNQNQFTFQSKNLIVHFFAFQYQDLATFQKNTIIEYFFNLGFNAFAHYGSDENPSWINLKNKPENRYQIVFRYPNLSPQSLVETGLVHFSGDNATQFYKLAKQKLIDWTILSSAKITRFDLHYCRYYKAYDNLTPEEFLQEITFQIGRTRRNVSFKKNQKGCLVTIGNRKTANFTRIYEEYNYLKFEHEYKGKKLLDVQSLLISHQFQQFEQECSRRFYNYLGRLLPLEYSYLDWLVFTLRTERTKFVQSKESQLGINSDYIKPTIFGQSIDFVRLIQFLKFVRFLDHDIEKLDKGSVLLRVYTFKIRDFLTMFNQKQSQYQLQKLSKFFGELHKNIVLESFQDTYYQWLSAVPLSKVYPPKKPGEFLIAKVWVADDLFYYDFPFYFPDFFFGKLKKHQIDVRIHILKVFSTPNVKKIFYIREFCDNYPAKLSNQQINKLRTYFIEGIEILRQANLIENQYQILLDGGFKNTQEFTSRNISQGFVIYEKINI